MIILATGIDWGETEMRPVISDQIWNIPYAGQTWCLSGIKSIINSGDFDVDKLDVNDLEYPNGTRLAKIPRIDHRIRKEPSRY